MRSSALFALALPLALGLPAAAQTNSSIVVCIAGQCLQGYSNTTLGTRLTVPGSPSDLLLLPGTYAESTNPELLHTQLSASNAKLAPSPGFDNATSVAFPLNVGLQAGVAAYSASLYAGTAGFFGLSNSSAGNASAPTALNADSLAIASGVWVAVAAGSSNKRIVLWDSLPDVAQLPTSASGALALLDIQGTACSPTCAGAGVCTAAGTCACPAGFNGTACETCSPKFFGPHCTACPAGCAKCDDGSSGSGLCLVPEIENAPASCNCLNGQCQSDGSCSCNSGWTKADNGTACAQCQSGFFLSSAGNCQVCQLGCDECVAGTGECTQCKTGFTQNANDNTKCLAPQSTTSSGQLCPDGSFGGGGSSCTPCAAECQTCSGGTSNDCVICANGKYANGNGTCVSTDSNGVCAGTTLVANNIKHECDSCPSKCTACGIPNFSVASTVDQLQCTGCLPGFVLSNGTCTESCPSSTFLSPKDNVTCEACDSSCGSCLGSSTFCLTCAGGQLASGGKCVSSCPSNTFSSSGVCITCHSDCASCTGTSFNQCSSCPADRPVLSNGRCLPTCAKAQFYDPTSNSCQACDSSCSSCSSSGSSGCLACSSSSQILQAGTCVDAKCTSNTTVVPGLGVCLSALVQVPSSTSTSGAALPSLTGISAPTVVINSGSRQLAWWEIMLMALGCAFIFLVVVLCWRRRARKQRRQFTTRFAHAKALAPKTSWHERLFFWRRTPAQGPVHLPTAMAMGSMSDPEALRLMRVRNAEEARHHQEMEKLELYGAYQHSHAGTVRSRSPRPNSAAETSLFSQATGEVPRAPQPRQPVREGDLLGADLLAPAPLNSRFSYSTYQSSEHRRAPSPAEAYAAHVRQDRLEPQQTGSNNPFRK